MRMFFTGMFLLVALSMTQPGFCAEDAKDQLADIDKKMDACLDEAGGVSSGMRDCMGTAANSMEALLDTSYKALLKKIKSNETYAEALKQEQIAWTKLRTEAAGNALVIHGGGNLGPLMAVNMSIEMIRKRIETITMLLSQ